jgi:hypothetical protein
MDIYSAGLPDLLRPALVNASKYTLQMLNILVYCRSVGLINTQYVGYGCILGSGFYVHILFMVCDVVEI